MEENVDEGIVESLVQMTSSNANEEDRLVQTVAVSDVEEEDLKVDGLVQIISISDDEEQDLEVDALVQTALVSADAEKDLKIYDAAQASKGNGISTHIQNGEDEDNQIVPNTKPERRRPCSLSTFSRNSVKAKGVRLSAGKRDLNIIVFFNLVNDADLIHLKPFIRRSIKCHTENIDGVICVSLVYSPNNYKKDVLKLKLLKINGKKLLQFRMHNLPRIRGLNVIVFFNLAKFADLIHLKPFIQRSTKCHAEEIDGITFVSLVYSTYHYKDDVLKLRNLEINGKKLSQFRTYNLPPIKRTCVRVNNLPATVETELLSAMFPKAEDIVIQKDEKCCAILTFPDLAHAEECLVERKGLKIMNNQLTMDIIDHNRDKALERTCVRVNNLPATVETELLRILIPKAVEIQKDAKCCVMLTFPDLPDAEQCIIEHTGLKMENNQVTMDIIESYHGKVLMTNGAVQEGKEPKHQQVYEALLQHVVQDISCESEEVTPQAKTGDQGTKDSSGSGSERFSIHMEEPRYIPLSTPMEEEPWYIPTSRGSAKSVSLMNDSHAVTSNHSRDRSRAVTSDHSHAVTSDHGRAITRDHSRAITSGHSRSVTSHRSRAITSDRSHAIASNRSHAVTSDRSYAIISDRSHAVTSDRSRALKSDPRAKNPVERYIMEIPSECILRLTRDATSQIEKDNQCALEFPDRDEATKDIKTIIFTGRRRIIGVAMKALSDVTKRPCSYLDVVVPRKAKRKVIDAITPVNKEIPDLKVLMSRNHQRAPIIKLKCYSDRIESLRDLVKKYIDLVVNDKDKGTLVDYIKAHGLPQSHQLTLIPYPVRFLRLPTPLKPTHPPPMNMAPDPQPPMHVPPGLQPSRHMPPGPQPPMYMPPGPQPSMHMPPGPQPPVHMPPGPQHMAPPYQPPMYMAAPHQPPTRMAPPQPPRMLMPPFNQPSAHFPPFGQPPLHRPPFNHPPVHLPAFDQPRMQVPKPHHQIQQSQASGSSSSQMSVRDEQMKQQIASDILAKLAPQADILTGSSYDKMQALIKNVVTTQMTEMKKQQQKQQPGSSPNLPASSSSIHNDNRDTRSRYDREGSRDGQEDRAGLGHRASEWAQKTSRYDEHSSILDDDLREYLEESRRHQSREHHSMHEKELQEEETWRRPHFDDHERDWRKDERQHQGYHAMRENALVKEAEMQREDQRLMDERDKLMDERRLLKRKHQEEEEEHQQHLLNQKQKLMEERKLIVEAKRKLKLQQQELDKKRIDVGQRFLAERNALRRHTSLTEPPSQAPSEPYRASLTSDPYSTSDVYEEMPSKQRDQLSYSGHYYNSSPNLQTAPPRSLISAPLMSAIHQPAMSIQDNVAYSDRPSNSSVHNPQGKFGVQAMSRPSGPYGVQTVSQPPSHVSSIQASHNIRPVNPNYGQIPGKKPGMMF